MAKIIKIILVSSLLSLAGISLAGEYKPVQKEEGGGSGGDGL